MFVHFDYIGASIAAFVLEFVASEQDLSADFGA